MDRFLYVVLKQEVKNGSTSLISVHWRCFEAEHIADINFNSMCLDDQVDYNYLVCRVMCRALEYQKGDTPRECFDRMAASPANSYSFYYKVLTTYGLKKKVKK